jgi:hypothetical protein
VVFKDGSSANLRQLKIINKGPGEICFEFFDLMPAYRDIDMSKAELHEVFDKIDSVEMAVNGAQFSLIRSKDNRTYIDVLKSKCLLGMDTYLLMAQVV